MLSVLGFGLKKFLCFASPRTPVGILAHQSDPFSRAPVPHLTAAAAASSSGGGLCGMRLFQSRWETQPNTYLLLFACFVIVLALQHCKSSWRKIYNCNHFLLPAKTFFLQSCFKRQIFRPFLVTFRKVLRSSISPFLALEWPRIPVALGPCWWRKMSPETRTCIVLWHVFED